MVSWSWLSWFQSAEECCEPSATTFLRASWSMSLLVKGTLSYCCTFWNPVSPIPKSISSLFGWFWRIHGGSAPPAPTKFPNICSWLLSKFSNITSCWGFSNFSEKLNRFRFLVDYRIRFRSWPPRLALLKSELMFKLEEPLIWNSANRSSLLSLQKLLWALASSPGCFSEKIFIDV